MGVVEKAKHPSAPRGLRSLEKVGGGRVPGDEVLRRLREKTHPLLDVGRLLCRQVGGEHLKELPEDDAGRPIQRWLEAGELPKEQRAFLGFRYLSFYRCP